MTGPTACYSFGRFMLDSSRGILLRDGVRVAVTPRTLDLLIALVERGGEILDKDELIRRVWAGTVVEENNLARQISSLRKLLGETPSQHDYIATIPGVGYRFVAPVVRVEPERAAAQPVAVAAPPAIAAPRLARARIVALAGGVIVIVAVLAALAARRGVHGTDAPAARTISQFTYGGASQQDPAWSPDGSRLAYASDRLGSLNLWVQRINDGDPVRVTDGPSRDWEPSWSPDGKSLVFRSERDGGGLFIVGAAGGPVRRVSTFGDDPQWSPSSQLILFSNATVRTGGRQLFVVSADGGAPREFCADAIRPFIATGAFSSIDANWFPDGQHVSIWGRLQDRWAFVTVPLDGGPAIASAIPDAVLRDLDRAQPRLGKFVWASSRRFVYFEGQSGDTRNVWRVAIDPATLAFAGAPERLTTDVGEEADIALSADGGRLAFTVRSPHTRVWSLGFDSAAGKLTGAAQAITAGDSGRVDVDTVADDSRLAYRALHAGRNEVREVTTSNREERVLLASSEWTPSAPRWSTDGRRLAYARLPGSGPAARQVVIAVLSPEDRHEQLIALPGGFTLRPSDWSRDGRTIFGDCRPSPAAHSDICAMDASGSAAPRILLHDAGRNLFGPRVSPDGRWLSFVAVDIRGSVTSQLFTAPIAGGEWLPITDGSSFDDKVRWSRDSDAVYFISSRGGHLNVYGRRFDSAHGRFIGDQFPVTAFDSPRRGLPASIAQIEFAVTHHHLVLPITESDGNVWVLDGVDT